MAPQSLAGVLGLRGRPRLKVSQYNTVPSSHQARETQPAATPAVHLSVHGGNPSPLPPTPPGAVKPKRRTTCPGDQLRTNCPAAHRRPPQAICWTGEVLITCSLPNTALDGSTYGRASCFWLASGGAKASCMADWPCQPLPRASPCSCGAAGRRSQLATDTSLCIPSYLTPRPLPMGALKGERQLWPHCSAQTHRDTRTHLSAPQTTAPVCCRARTGQESGEAARAHLSYSLGKYFSAPPKGWQAGRPQNPPDWAADK